VKFAGHEAVREQAAQPQAHGFDQEPAQQPFAAAGENQDIHLQPPVRARLSHHQHVTFGPAELPGHEHVRAAPIGDGHVHDVAGNLPQQSIVNRVPGNQGTEARAAGTGMRTIDPWFAVQLAMMYPPPMLGIKTVGAEEIPGTFAHEAERTGSGKILRRGVRKKRQLKERHLTMKNEDVTMTNRQGIILLSGEGGNVLLSRNVQAFALNSVLPVVIRALDGLADHSAFAQVCPHVRTTGIEEGDLSSLRPKRDELPAPNLFGHRSPAKVLDRA